VIVDPKQADWSRYSGAYLVKPNLKEFYETSGAAISDVSVAASKSLGQYDVSNILITRSQDGMTLVDKKNARNFPTDAKEVFDVSGAGDTVAATIGVMLAAGLTIDDAVRISNVAAGIVVGKIGACAVSWNEVVSAANRTFSKKIMTNSESVIYANTVKCRNKKVVFTNGCFDILHTGHIALLEQAKRYGDVLIVGLNSDSSVKRLKGENRPINNEFDRAKILSSLEFVDAVVIFNEDTPFELISDIVPDVIVKGADYNAGNVVGADIVTRNGGEVVLVPLVSEKSTTGIIEKSKKKG
jgi:D-beta-D-heptose 7-phosphate kinase/D-beta-D-heptose 1-phosphate adenosyltransferase